MVYKNALLTALCLFVIAGCAYLKTRRDVHFKNYAVNVDEQTSVGLPMVISEHAEYAIGSRKYGLAEEQDPWQSFEYPTQHSFKDELIYHGRKDNIIYITYRQYKGRRMSPSSSQELTYDLGHSHIILFKNYKIKVLNATGEYIRFRVLSD